MKKIVGWLLFLPLLILLVVYLVGNVWLMLIDPIGRIVLGILAAGVIGAFLITRD